MYVVSKWQHAINDRSFKLLILNKISTNITPFHFLFTDDITNVSSHRFLREKDTQEVEMPTEINIYRQIMNFIYHEENTVFHLFKVALSW